MKRLRYILLFVFVLCVTIGHAQAPTQIKKKCPNISIYSIVSITAVGDILYNPCPSRSSIFTRTVDFTNATVIGLPFTASPLTTKGDLWGFSTLNTRVPVGANGLVLTADSTNPRGVAWAAAGGGGTVTGTGTTNRMTKWSNGAGGVIADSLLISNTTDVSPVTARNIALGTTALPFSDIFFSNAANSGRITGTFTANRTFTFPNATGSVVLASSALTSGFFPLTNSANTTVSNSPFTFFPNQYDFNNVTNTSRVKLTLVPSSGVSTKDASLFWGDDIDFNTYICARNGVTGSCGSTSFQVNNPFIRMVSGDGSIISNPLGGTIALESGFSNTGINGGVVILRAYNHGGSAQSPALIVDGQTQNVSLVKVIGDFIPECDGVGTACWKLGNSTHPFTSLFVGGATANNIQLTGTATAARVITLPDATGTVQLVGGSGTISGLTATKIPVAASATTLADSRITDNGAGAGDIVINSGADATVIGDQGGLGNSVNFQVIDAIKQFFFNVGIIKINSDCAGVKILGGAGTVNLGTTACFALSTGTPIVLVTGRDTTGILTVNAGGLVTSSAGALDANDEINYWIIDTP